MNSSRSARAFPFIVGFARSGTTLVRAMLDSHPEMAIPGESHFIVSFARDRRRYERAGGFDTAAFLQDLSAHPRFVRWELEDGLVEGSLNRGHPTNLADAIRDVYAVYAQAHEKPRFGDKTPSYLLHITMLGELFPEARFVHVIRDGRDVCLSHLDVALGQRTVEGVALNWTNHVERGRSAGRDLGAGRYMELRYEDLVVEPETAIRSVCDFLELSFESDMMRYFERSDEIRQPTQHPEAHRSLALPPTKGLRDWRRQMSRDDLALFEALAGDLLTHLGYGRSEQRLAAIDMARVQGRAAWARAGLLAHRIRKRLGLRARL